MKVLCDFFSLLVKPQLFDGVEARGSVDSFFLSLWSDSICFRLCFI